MSSIERHNKDIGLVNQIISDLTSKSDISDGVFTLGELHSDRITLYVFLLNLMTRIYSLKGMDTSEMIWKSPKDCLGKQSPKGYVHLGFTLGEDIPTIGALIPEAVVLEMNDVKELQEAPSYKPLYKSISLIKY